MKNIYAILTEIGIEIPADKKAEFDKSIADNYKTIVEFDKKSEKLTAAEATIESLKDGIAKSPKPDDVKALQDKITAYETAETERKAAEAKAAEHATIYAQLDTALGEKKFVNDRTKNSIYADVISELEKPENKGKGANELLNSLIKDVDGIFANPQQAQGTIPAAKKTAATTSEYLSNKYKNNPFFNE